MPLSNLMVAQSCAVSTVTTPVMSLHVLQRCMDVHNQLSDLQHQLPVSAVCPPQSHGFADKVHPS